ncbi:MAG: hypothetical protein ABIA04_03035 [Pseudomonadota bacterium]
MRKKTTKKTITKTNKSKPEPILPDFLRKAVQTGFELAFFTEDNIKNIISELKLPKETASNIISEAKGKKEEIFIRLIGEITKNFGKISLSKELTKAFANLELDIKANIKIKRKKNED